jgi:hypothetical protein
MMAGGLGSLGGGGGGGSSGASTNDSTMSKVEVVEAEASSYPVEAELELGLSLGSGGRGGGGGGKGKANARGERGRILTAKDFPSVVSQPQRPNNNTSISSACVVGAVSGTKRAADSVSHEGGSPTAGRWRPHSLFFVNILQICFICFVRLLETVRNLNILLLFSFLVIICSRYVCKYLLFPGRRGFWIPLLTKHD